jgi:hypothetical protein
MSFEQPLRETRVFAVPPTSLNGQCNRIGAPASGTATLPNAFIESERRTNGLAPKDCAD